MIYCEVDNNGLFVGVRSPLNKDRSTGEWLKPVNCLEITPPVNQVGYVAVISDDLKDWIYKKDNSGKWFNIDSRVEVNIDYPLSIIPNNYIRQPLSVYESYIKESKEIIFNLIEYKKDKIAEVSARCNAERLLILDDTKILNVLSGATIGYPDYLTPDNVAKLIEVYKNIYHTYAAKINTAGSGDEVDLIVSSIVYPTAEYILKNIRGL